MHHYLDYMSQMNSMPLLPVNHNGSLILLQGTAKTHSPRIYYLNWQSWALTRIANIHCIMGSFDIEEEYGLVQTSKWKKTSCKHFMPVVLVPTLALLLLITASRHYLLGQESFNQWNLLSTSVKSVSKLRLNIKNSLASSILYPFLMKHGPLSALTESLDYQSPITMIQFRWCTRQAKQTETELIPKNTSCGP